METRISLQHICVEVNGSHGSSERLSFCLFCVVLCAVLCLNFLPLPFSVQDRMSRSWSLPFHLLCGDREKNLQVGKILLNSGETS